MAVGIFPAAAPDMAVLRNLGWSDCQWPLQYMEIPVQAPAEEAGPQS
ncbi:hypothetical protein [Sphingorhabdus contaminans]